MMSPAGSVSAPNVSSSALSSDATGTSSPADPESAKLDFRTVQNLLAGLLAEWGLAANVVGSNSISPKSSAAQAGSKTAPASSELVSAISQPATGAPKPQPGTDADTTSTIAQAGANTLTAPVNAQIAAGATTANSNLPGGTDIKTANASGVWAAASVLPPLAFIDLGGQPKIEGQAGKIPTALRSSMANAPIGQELPSGSPELASGVTLPFFTTTPKTTAAQSVAVGTTQSIARYSANESGGASAKSVNAPAISSNGDVSLTAVGSLSCAPAPTDVYPLGRAAQQLAPPLTGGSIALATSDPTTDAASLGRTIAPGSSPLPLTGNVPSAAIWSGAVSDQMTVGSAEAAPLSALGVGQVQESKRSKADSAMFGTENSASTMVIGDTPSSAHQSVAPTDQVATVITARVQQLGPDGRTDIHLQLQPPDLGPVRVHLSSVDGQISARLVVREDATRQLLQTHLDALAQRLSQAGINLGRFDVSQDGAAFQERGQNAESAGPTGRGTRASTPSAQNTAGNATPPAGVIDVIA